VDSQSAISPFLGGYVYTHIQMRMRSLERARRRYCLCVHMYNTDVTYTIEMLYTSYICETLYVFTHTQTRMRTLSVRDVAIVYVFTYTIQTFFNTIEMLYTVYICETLYVYTHIQMRMRSLERARRRYCICVYVYNTDVTCTMGMLYILYNI